MIPQRIIAAMAVRILIFLMVITSTAAIPRANPLLWPSHSLLVLQGQQAPEVTRVQPPVLTVEAGRAIGAVITGTNLSVVRTLRGEQDGRPVATITGIARCRESTSCTLTISTTAQTSAGQYQLALLGSDQQVLAHLPVVLTVEATPPPPRATISSMRPPVLLVEAGESVGAALIGNGLNAAEIVEGSLGQTVERTIGGSLSCRTGRSCNLTIITTSETPAGSYDIALLDRDRKFLVHLPSELTVEVSDTPPVVIRSIEPSRLRVEAGQTLDILITGEGLSVVQGAEAQRQGRLVADIQVRAACPDEKACRLSVSTTSRVEADTYQLILLDIRGRPLVTLPADLTITHPPEGPIEVITIEGDPDVIVSRSCLDPSSTDVMVLTSPGGRLAINGELPFRRAPADYCTGAGGVYRVRFCTTSDICNSGPFWEYTFSPTADEIPAHYTIEVGQNMWQTIGAELGLLENDTVYWQVSLRSGPFPAPPVSFSDIQPLIYIAEPFTAVCDPGTPPQLWDPLPNERIHATNRGFYWCDDLSAQSWRVCWSRPGAEACSFEHLALDNAVTTLNYHDFDTILGLIGGELEWKVKACTDIDGLQCSAYSAPWRAKVPMPPARPLTPRHNGQNIPVIPVQSTFEWESVNGADSYVFIISHSQSAPFRVDFIEKEISAANTTYSLSPADFVQGNLDFFLDGGVSTWEVAACYFAPDGDRVCSDWQFSPDPTEALARVQFGDQPVPGQVNFADDFLSVLRSPSCVRCHSVVADAAFPEGHPGITLPDDYFSNFANLTSDQRSEPCVGCHSANLVNSGLDASAITLDLPWQPAPVSDVNMDFRDYTDTELCARAQDAGSLDDVPVPPEAQAKLDALKIALGEPELDPLVAHLAYDPLILWAVRGGMRPLGSGPTVAAFDGAVQEWQALVRAWVGLGMPCQ